MGRAALQRRSIPGVNDFNSSIRLDQRGSPRDMAAAASTPPCWPSRAPPPGGHQATLERGCFHCGSDLFSGRFAGFDPAATDVHNFVDRHLLRPHSGMPGRRRTPAAAATTRWPWILRATLRMPAAACSRDRSQELVKACAARTPGPVRSCRATPTCRGPSPSPFAHALTAYAWTLLRDLERFVDATARMDAQRPWAAAHGGHHLPAGPAFTAEKLGFDAPAPTAWTAYPTGIALS